MLPSQEFVYTRTYARWLPEAGRRETWPETVNRVVSYIETKRSVPPKVLRRIRKYMLSFEVLPSMRLVWAAGPAAEASPVTIYNCSFMAMRDPADFAEMLYILMCGTGVGFSVEDHNISQLPVVPIFPEPYNTIQSTSYVVKDSKEGWADSVKDLLIALYSRCTLSFDYSLIRPKGARLATMGGRASGPEPLILLHDFICETFTKAQGRKLLPLEVHDICNKIAEIVVVGGVRRSSQISLSDLNDEAMQKAKQWPCPVHRFMANNSAVYKSKPSSMDFMKEWYNLAASGSGERGIFNLEATRASAPARRNPIQIEGTNPCGEIALRNHQFCNLSTVIVRGSDSMDSLFEKVETAAWIGTIQASFTDFPYLRPSWKANCEAEALLGISLSGQMDNIELLRQEKFLSALRDKAVKVNKAAAKHLGISQAAAVTCGKPEGTTSQLTHSGSGCHPWYSKYYIRRYRISAADPLAQLLKDQGLPLVPEVGQDEATASTLVVEFPTKAPEGALTRDMVSSLEQLEWYKLVQTNWCEHNQSITVYVKPDEWLRVGNWVYDNWNIACGLSFLPYDGGHYKLAPYEEITKEEYNSRMALFPALDYTKLSLYEAADNTEGAKAYACVGNSCEVP